MKIRTLENLNQRLNEDFIWRKKEIADLNNLIQSRSSSPNKQLVLLRSGVSILYAHWEGYIKTVATSYLEFVARQKFTYDELAINFVAVAMKAKLSEATETNKATIFTEVAKFMLTQMNDRCLIRHEDIITTASNLSSIVLSEITCILGLDYSFYKIREIIIDEQLLKRRNAIAHGEYLSLDRAEYTNLQYQILAMMEYFRNQVENNAAQKLYLRNPLI
jgi:hypothetical protein